MTSLPNHDRLPFLDVLRGLAALAVVFEHGFAVCIPGYLDWSFRYFELGQFGVTLFLLISGFIIPVTLERGGSNARFWVNRFFRLFPLYWATIAFFALYYLLLGGGDFYPPRLWHWLANLTMLQEFVRVPHVTAVFWTLTLELGFYASCSLLYALGLTRWTWLLVWLGQAGLVALGVVYPLVFDRRFPGGYAFLILTMFVGTMFYRCTAAQLSRKHLAAMLTVLAPVAMAVSYVCFALYPRERDPLTFHCVLCIWLAAYAVFALTLRWRSLPMPGVLAYFGRISYSIYLVHTWLVRLLPSDWPAIAYLGTLVGGTLALSTLTYHVIESPCIRLGRRLLAKKPVANSPPVEVDAMPRRRAA